MTNCLHQTAAGVAASERQQLHAVDAGIEEGKRKGGGNGGDEEEDNTKNSHRKYKRKYTGQLNVSCCCREGGWSGSGRGRTW